MTGQLDETIDNYDWFVMEIQKAKSMERLRYLAQNIEYAKWEDEPWTKDEESMERLRIEWGNRAHDVEDGKAA